MAKSLWSRLRPAQHSTSQSPVKVDILAGAGERSIRKNSSFEKLQSQKNAKAEELKGFIIAFLLCQISAIFAFWHGLRYFSLNSNK
jgi:hypothetical protein